MGTKVTSSSGSVLEKPEIQKLQMQAKIFKENSLNNLNALKSTTQLLERQTFSGCPLYQQAFAQLFGDGVRTFKKGSSPEESSSTSQPLEQVKNHDENDVFANVRRHSEQPESINDTYVLEKDDSNVILIHQIYVIMISEYFECDMLFVLNVDGTCVFNSNHDACVCSILGNDVNACPVPQSLKTFDRTRSSLILHGYDVCSHQFRPRSSSNDF
ncbi:hypothetical protein Tco_0690514 [Tanacetum coccineum]